METQIAQDRKILLKYINKLSSEKIKEVLDFVCFIKAKDSIDPTQVYFWTKKWQNMERRAEEDKEKDKIIGDGTVKYLLKELKK